MTRTRYKIFETEYPYFMTCTVVGWVPVFTRPQAAQIIFDSWQHHQCESQFEVFGYVILENHLHLIAAAPDLPAVMQSFKSYTAKQILDLLQRHKAEVLLRQLRALKLSHKNESEYQVWQEGSKPKQIQSEEMV